MEAETHINPQNIMFLSQGCSETQRILRENNMTKASLDDIAATPEDRKKIEGRLRALDAEALFGIGYGAYEYLRDLETPVSSGTYSLLQKLKAGDFKTILKCVNKMVEEQEESRDAALLKHSHEGETKEEVILTELQQSIYWPTLIAVGSGVPYNQLKLAEFIEHGYQGFHIAAFDKDLEEGCEKDNINQVVLVRQAAVIAGNNMRDYNTLVPECIIRAEDIAKHDLKQMLQRPYLLDKIKKDLAA